MTTPLHSAGEREMAEMDTESRPYTIRHANGESFSLAPPPRPPGLGTLWRL